MDHDDLRHWSKRAADWAHDYHATLRNRPVRAQTTPGATAARLPRSAPEAPEPIEAIFADFASIVPDAHDPLAAPALLRLFPRQCRTRLDAGRTARQCHRGAGDAVADLAGRDRDRGGDDRLAGRRARPARPLHRHHPRQRHHRDAVRGADHARTRARLGRQRRRAGRAAGACGSTPAPRPIPRSTRRRGLRGSARPTW